MYALTVWAPWSTLIIEGWKPYEFRGWDYRRHRPGLVGQRIAIHAGARPVKLSEVEDLLARMNGKHSRVSEAARPFLVRLTRMIRERRRSRRSALAPLAAVLGTAVIGEPIECRTLFGSGVLTYPDSDRVAQQAWAWPLSDIERFPVPVPARGAQNFWHWPDGPA
jgi:hypothetical protein